MRISFFSNYFNHHQKSLCNAFVNIPGVDYVFVETMEIEKERKNMGWGENIPEYVLQSWVDKDKYNLAKELANNSDIVIIGAASSEFIKSRIIQNKLTFRYAERIFKQGIWRMFTPIYFLSLIKAHTRFQKKQLYMRCASAYTAADFSLIGAYSNKMFKWGYFPEFIEYNLDDIMALKHQPKINILWCARMLQWKHPEKALLVSILLRSCLRTFQPSLNTHIKTKSLGHFQLKTQLKKDH
jgi:hypothetical protein